MRVVAIQVSLPVHIFEVWDSAARGSMYAVQDEMQDRGTNHIKGACWGPIYDVPSFQFYQQRNLSHCFILVHGPDLIVHRRAILVRLGALRLR